VLGTSQLAYFIGKSVVLIGDFFVLLPQFCFFRFEFLNFFFLFSSNFPGIGDLIICGRAVTSEELPEARMLFEITFKARRFFIGLNSKIEPSGLLSSNIQIDDGISNVTIPMGEDSFSAIPSVCLVLDRNSFNSSNTHDCETFSIFITPNEADLNLNFF